MEPEVDRIGSGEDPEAADPHEQPSVLQLYMRDARQTPLLTPAEEAQLAARIGQGDAAARERMIKANLRLVVKIAHDYNHLGLPLMDLISEGNIGLIKAVERFDPRKGGKLCTYAAWWIRQSMKRALANQSKTIRLPVHLVDRIVRMRRVTQQYTEQFGREPDNEELALEMGLPVEKVALYRAVSVHPASLDAPLSEDPTSAVLGDIVGDENAVDPREDLGEKNLFADLRAAVGHLEPREGAILTLRFGLDGTPPQTLEEIGRRFKVTRERIRQLETLALRRIRRQMTNRDRQHSWEEIEADQRARRRAQVLREYFAQHAARLSARRPDPLPPTSPALRRGRSRAQPKRRRRGRSVAPFGLMRVA